MKINKIKIKNLGKVVNMEIELDGSITRLVGLNGSAKTTIGLTSIWACFKGIASRGQDQLIGDRFRFIGDAGKSTDIDIVLQDCERNNRVITMKRKITDRTNNISFHVSDRSKLDEAWLLNLLDVVFLSAKHFTALDSKQQALALGVDTSEYDERILREKDIAKDIRSEIKAFGEAEYTDKCASVSTSDLVQELREADTFNDTQRELETKYRATSEKLKQLKEESKIILERIKKGETLVNSMKQPENTIDTKPIQDKIANAETINKKAMAYENYKNHIRNVDKKSDELRQNKEQQEQIQEERIQYIQGFDFGLEGLTVDDTGQLTLNNKLIRDPYFSKGELEVIVATLHIAQNPELKVRFIDDFDLLDELNQEKLLKKLVDKGFQVITAEVGDAKEKPNTILLRECRRVEE